MRGIRTLLIIALAAALLAVAGVFAFSEPALSATRAKPGTLTDVRTAFRPSRDGFAFINRPGVSRDSILGPVFAGLCGGMSFAALDYYSAAKAPPPGGIDRFLLLRSAESMVANGTSFVLWTLAPDVQQHPGAFGVATATRAVEVPALDAALRKGPVPLGLVRSRELGDLAQDHQVVAYALQLQGDTVRIRVYDPNHPRSDDTFLVLDLAKPDAVRQVSGGSTLHTWRGFFVERYSPAAPPRS